MIGPLKDARRERFCVAIVRGDEQIEAYESAGYVPNKSRASRLRKRGEVAARIRELMHLAADEAIVAAEDVIRELKLIAFSDMADHATWGPGTVTLKDSEDLGDASRAVAEVHETTTITGGTVKFKLHDKMRALEMLAKHLGIFEADNSQKTAPQVAIMVAYPANGRDSK